MNASPWSSSSSREYAVLDHEDDNVTANASEYNDDDHNDKVHAGRRKGNKGKKKQQTPIETDSSLPVKLPRKAASSSSVVSVRSALSKILSISSIKHNSESTLGKYCLRRYEENATFFEHHVSACVDIIIDVLLLHVKEQYDKTSTICKTLYISLWTLQRLVRDVESAMTEEQRLWFSMFLIADNVKTVSTAVCASPRWSQQDLKCKRYNSMTCLQSQPSSTMYGNWYASSSIRNNPFHADDRSATHAPSAITTDANNPLFCAISLSLLDTVSNKKQMIV